MDDTANQNIAARPSRKPRALKPLDDTETTPVQPATQTTVVVGERPQFELLASGNIVRNGKTGKPSLLAVYDEDTKTLTFESDQMDQKYRSPILRAVAETPDGEPTGYAVARFMVKGREPDAIRPNEPPPPAINKMLGDKTPKFVQWLFKWRPQSAYARYGVLLDSNGEPRRAKCFRIEQGLLEENETDRPTVIAGDGKDALSLTVTKSDDGILARQRTCMTFTIDEIVDKDDPEAGERAPDIELG